MGNPTTNGKRHRSLYPHHYSMVISTGSFRQMSSTLSLFFAVKSMWMNAQASERDSRELRIARMPYVVLLTKTLPLTVPLSIQGLAMGYWRIYFRGITRRWTSIISKGGAEIPLGIKGVLRWCCCCCSR